MIRWWIQIWDRKEDPRSLALVRVLLACVLVADWLWIARLGMVEGLFAPLKHGGMGNPTGRGLWLYSLLPPDSAAWIGYFTLLICAILLAVGLLPRLAAAALVLVWAQLAQALPASDRGIDMLMRNAILLLAFSRCGDALSLQARLKTGSWLGDGRLVPAWPRYLLVMQLVILYFTAGVQKVSTAWTPLGGFSALYIAMRDPAFSMGDWPWLSRLYPMTQALTAGTWAWEWAAPLLLLAFHYRDTRARPGRLRALLNRTRFLRWYLAVGALFHLGTALTMQLGIFPWAVLSLYPACFHPDELRRRRAPRGAGSGVG